MVGVLCAFGAEFGCDLDGIVVAEASLEGYEVRCGCGCGPPKFPIADSWSPVFSLPCSTYPRVPPDPLQLTRPFRTKDFFHSWRLFTIVSLSLLT